MSDELKEYCVVFRNDDTPDVTMWERATRFVTLSDAVKAAHDLDAAGVYPIGTFMAVRYSDWQVLIHQTNEAKRALGLT